MKRSRTLIGTNGVIWLNSELVENFGKIVVKVTGSFEEENYCGHYSTEHVYTGWSGEGTLTTMKWDSRFVKLLGEAFTSGVPQDLKIITKLEDKVTGKCERIFIGNIKITEFTLANYESKGRIEEELPFNFSEFKILETI